MAEWSLLVCLITYHGRPIPPSSDAVNSLLMIWNLSRTLDDMFFVSFVPSGGIHASTSLRSGELSCGGVCSCFDLPDPLVCSSRSVTHSKFYLRKRLHIEVTNGDEVPHSKRFEVLRRAGR